MAATGAGRLRRAASVLLLQTPRLPARELSAPARLYHKKVVDHYENPRNVGTLDKTSKNVGTGLVGAPACGDVMKLQVQLVFIGNGNGNRLAYVLQSSQSTCMSISSGLQLDSLEAEGGGPHTIGAEPVLALLLVPCADPFPYSQLITLSCSLEQLKFRRQLSKRFCEFYQRKTTAVELAIPCEMRNPINQTSSKLQQEGWVNRCFVRNLLHQGGRGACQSSHRSQKTAAGQGGTTRRSLVSKNKASARDHERRLPRSPGQETQQP